jgi:DNA-nicking Smr family endonuclease
MSRRRSLSDEERVLWTGVARSIKPLHPSRRVEEIVESEAEGNHPAKPAKVSRRASPPRATPSHEPRVEKKPPPFAPLERKLKRRVARGREPIDARIDLHGFTQTQAHGALLNFLQRAQADGVRIALVVTGKGTRKSDDTREHGVLKRQVPLWLALPTFRSLVVGFEDAHIAHGGGGALYIRLRRGRRHDD